MPDLATETTPSCMDRCNIRSRSHRSGRLSDPGADDPGSWRRRSRSRDAGRLVIPAAQFRYGAWQKRDWKPFDTWKALNRAGSREGVGHVVVEEHPPAGVGADDELHEVVECKVQIPGLQKLSIGCEITSIDCAVQHRAVVNVRQHVHTGWFLAHDIRIPYGRILERSESVPKDAGS